MRLPACCLAALSVGLLAPAADSDYSGLRQCHGAANCESCAALGCGWCPDLRTPAVGRCLERDEAESQCGSTLQWSCLNERNLKLDTDRVSHSIEQAVPSERHAETTPTNGRRIARALGLQTHMERIVDAFPTARFLSTEPPIIQIDNFFSEQECNTIISAAQPTLKPSSLNAGKHRFKAVSGHGCEPHESWEVRAACVGRSSYSAYCTGRCAQTPAIQAIEAKIANITGFSTKNMEPLHILRYTGL